MKDPGKPILEVCVADLDSLRAAAEGGAGRIELCSALSEGGLTPSPGLIRESRKMDGLQIHILIRPRSGDFIYSPAEISCMEADIEFAAANGADGIVIGALLPDGSIDLPTCRRLIRIAKDLHIENITFHRAFDLCRNPEEALEQIIDLGCNRLLTSGRQASAEAGIACLKKLHEQSDGRIIILPGGGINPENAARIMNETGSHELHASARKTIESTMTYRLADVSMGTPGNDEYSRKVTDRRIVKRIIEEMDKYPQYNPQPPIK